MSNQLTPSYYQQRMDALGITAANNEVLLWQSTKYGEEGNGENVLKPFTIFRESATGIEILVYTLHRQLIRTTKKLERKSGDIKAADKPYTITRLEHPKVRANGKVQKYDKPYGELSYPFFPPALLDKYDRCVQWLKDNPMQALPDELRIKNLYMTEGFFKAEKSCLSNISCVGLQSISCLRDKSTNQLWEDITTLIKTCGVKNLVWLTDGDFMNITAKDLTDGIDLAQRPNHFYDSAYTFYTLTSHLDNVETYFGHINSEELATTDEKGHVITAGPKGLDDLLIEYPDKQHEIAMEFNNFSIMAPGKVYPGQYITRINMSTGTAYVRKYILKDDVTAFYLHHKEKRPELANVKTFKYFGAEYRYDEKEGKCVIEIPGDANDYIRAGNDYYKHIIYPDKKGKPLKSLDGRAKTTIIDDHGKDFLKHIKKYEKFCIVPNHFNYQQVIHNCYNMYNAFVHEPEPGDYSQTLAFVKHIFSEEICRYKDEETGQVTEIPRWELGLDYLTIAYRDPGQMLPILSLVSRERQTGKTSFVDWLDAIFVNNCINIGNEDLEADFNAHWAGKLFIVVDETKVDNGKVINKIKRLSTAADIVMNAKGKDQVKLPFFAKFILNSNHVEDFIRIDKEENRFWIQKVPRLPSINPKFMETLIEEIPAFLHFLSIRNIKAENKERHWFSTQLLQTDALHVVKENSISGMEKKIRTFIGGLFELSGWERITMPTSAIAAGIKGADVDYVKKTLREMELSCISGRYKYPRPVQKPVAELGELAEQMETFEPIHGNNTHWVFERDKFTNVAMTVPGFEENRSLTAENGTPAADDKELPF